MNSKTAKLIKRYVARNGENYKLAKAAWNRLPRTQRATERQRMKATL